MYIISRVALPLYFQNLFALYNHAHNTRQTEKLHVISHNTNVQAYSIQENIWC